MAKLILTIQVHQLPSNTGDWNNPEAKFLKGAIANKIKDYLDRTAEEE